MRNKILCKYFSLKTRVNTEPGNKWLLVAADMATSNVQQPAKNQFFYEDEVFKILSRNNQVKFGLVIENYEAINSTDDEFEDSLKKGEIRVVWHPEGKEEILAETQVRRSIVAQSEFSFFFLLFLSLHRLPSSVIVVNMLLLLCYVIF